jgi:hypothetical protein
MSSRIYDETEYRLPHLQVAYFSQQELPIALFGVNLPPVFLGQYTTLKYDAASPLSAYADPYARVLVAGLELSQIQKGDNRIVKVIPDQGHTASAPFEVSHAHIERPFLLNNATIGKDVFVGTVPGQDGDVHLLYVQTQDAQKRIGAHVMAINFGDEGTHTTIKIGDAVQMLERTHQETIGGVVAGFRLNMPQAELPEILVDVLHGEVGPVHRFVDYHQVAPAEAIL